MIYTYVGHEPPAESADWQLAATPTTPVCKVAFAVDLPPGTRVWVTACWLSPTAVPGPLSQPIDAYLTPGLRFSTSLGQAA